MRVNYWVIYGLVVSLISGWLFAPFRGWLVVPLFLGLFMLIGYLDKLAGNSLGK